MGSSVKLITREVLEKLRHKQESLAKVTYPSVGISDKMVPIFEIVNLAVVLGGERFRDSSVTSTQNSLLLTFYYHRTSYSVVKS